jgi:hypothetical protein
LSRILFAASSGKFYSGGPGDRTSQSSATRLPRTWEVPP